MQDEALFLVPAHSLHSLTALDKKRLNREKAPTPTLHFFPPPLLLRPHA
jgi:hypothetical protein